MSDFSDSPDWQDDEQDEWVSKTDLKKAMLARQELGEKLVNLGDNALSQVPLDESLQEAIALARRIRNKREGYRRQLQYIGKLMRSRDIEPIQAALDKMDNKHNQQTVAFQRLEQWRDRLIAEGDDAINEFVAQYPNAERQQLRQLIRNANREAKQNKPPKSARELFKLIRAEAEAAGEF